MIMDEQKDLLIKWVGNLEANIESDVYEGKILDSKVSIEGGVLCVVAGSDREKFLNELNAVISKYQI